MLATDQVARFAVFFCSIKFVGEVGQIEEFRISKYLTVRKGSGKAMVSPPAVTLFDVCSRMS